MTARPDIIVIVHVSQREVRRVPLVFLPGQIVLRPTVLYR